MKSLLTTCLILFVIVVPVSSKNLSVQNIESFELVWQTVNKSHFDPTFGGVDWKEMYGRYRPQIDGVTDIEEFNRITNRMLFELKLSHLLVASEQMLKVYMPTLFAEGTTGIDVRWMDEKAVITKIKPDSRGQAAGLKSGFVITHIDGRGINEIIREAEVLPPYNDRNRRGGISNYIMGHISGTPHTAVSVRCLDENSRPKEVKIVRQSRGAGAIISEAMPPVFIDFTARRLEGNIGYFWFNHFAHPVDKAFLQAMKAMHDTRGLIFDVRGNPGGYFRIMDTIVEHLITNGTPLYRFRFRDKTIQKALNPSKDPYKKPVVVLIDVTSMSCSEHFAVCLQAIGRAVIVGERSPGYLVGANWIKLPNGASFMHTILEPISYGGRIVEGNGVRPDIEIMLSHEKLLMGKDNQLEAAVAYILRKSTH